MGPTKDSASRALTITIVSDNPETLDGLQGYLEASGVSSRGTRGITTCVDATTPSTSAVVFFPDDSPWDKVTLALEELHHERPTVLCVLVTREPLRANRLLERDGNAPLLVIAKPAWGWDLLETIRARLEELRP
jgi:hypothetical protein